MTARVVTLGLLLAAVPQAFAFALPPGSDVAHPLIFTSAWLAMTGWFLGLAYGPTVWAVGSGLQALHVAVAFHLAHAWSHAAAFEHTRQVGGVGEGVYVNYLFTAVWLLDASWRTLSPQSYRCRPRWLSAGVYGFTGFIVFNAMFVFGGWPARGLFVVLVFWLWMTWRAGSDRPR